MPVGVLYTRRRLSGLARKNWAPWMWESNLQPSGKLSPHTAHCGWLPNLRCASSLPSPCTSPTSAIHSLSGCASRHSSAHWYACSSSGRSGSRPEPGPNSAASYSRSSLSAASASHTPISPWSSVANCDAWRLVKSSVWRARLSRRNSSTAAWLLVRWYEVRCRRASAAASSSACCGCCGMWAASAGCLCAPDSEPGSSLSERGVEGPVEGPRTCGPRSGTPAATPTGMGAGVQLLFRWWLERVPALARSAAASSRVVATASSSDELLVSSSPCASWLPLIIARAAGTTGISTVRARR
mmetsp:Transcript_11633/g.28516  ORF Transcript_11633/g.28516 Transcript_11633/m.28516 type:complete len:298 (+) Transcript_11633:744-1637(+)